jgi:hypothetical protein
MGHADILRKLETYGPWAIPLGTINGADPIRLFGHRPSADALTSPGQDIANHDPLVDLYAGFPADADTISISSSSIQDNPAGTGASQITITGTDATRAWQEVTYPLDGTTPVVSTEEWRSAKARISGPVGAIGTNVGIITVAHTSAAAVRFARIEALEGESKNGAYSVPTNRVAVITSTTATVKNVGGGPTAKASIELAWVFRLGPAEPWIQTNEFVYQNEGPRSVPYEGVLAFPEGSDFVIRAIGATVDNIDIGIAIHGLLLTNGGG